MNHWRFFPTITLFLFALIVILLANGPDAETVSASPIDAGRNPKQQQETNNETFANCRYGATPADDDDGEKAQALSRLGAGWYLTFNVSAPTPPPENNAEFVHMIHVKQKKNGFNYLPGFDIQPPLDNKMKKRVQNNPGDLWIIGNEIDRGPSPGEQDPTNRGQGDTYPEIYALAYHDVYKFIKNIDPTAQIAISGLVEVTPGRLQYLDKVWNTYLQEYGQPMPVDVWTMHLYILPEVQPDGITPNGVANVALGTNPALGKRESGGNAAACSDPAVYCSAEHDDIGVFAEQVVSMRQWMANHGQRQKPLILSEYSLLYPYVDDGGTCFIQDEFGNCFKPARVLKFMNKTFDYLNDTAKDPNLGYTLDNNRLIQQYMWFSIYNEGVGEVSNLLEKDLVTFTALGQAFKNRVFNEAVTQNLLIEQVNSVNVVAAPGKTATAEISVTFRNNGNSSISEPFTVTFYEDALLTTPIASVEISADILGCTSRPYTASVQWSGLEDGIHNFWVKIDSEDVIDEDPPGNNDNRGSGHVRVVSNSILLPVVQAAN